MIFYLNTYEFIYNNIYKIIIFKMDHNLYIYINK